MRDEFWDFVEEDAPPIYLSRRALIHRAIGIGVGLTAGPLLQVASATAGTNRERGMSSMEASQTLNILTWETYDNQPWLNQFKKKTGITVHATNVGSPAVMFAKTKANPGEYDIV
jgi:spermidine/putrescine-binding protein